MTSWPGDNAGVDPQPYSPLSFKSRIPVSVGSIEVLELRIYRSLEIYVDTVGE